MDIYHRMELVDMIYVMCVVVWLAYIGVNNAMKNEETKTKKNSFSLIVIILDFAMNLFFIYAAARVILEWSRG